MSGRPSPIPAEGFATVVFDCDSTLASIEGIDELAVHHAEEVRALTAAAMEGTIPIHAVYGSRLEMIRPTRGQLDALGEAYVAALVPDARETVAALLSIGKTVRVVSGGLRPAVEAAARALGLDGDDVFAVGIHFNSAGEYAGFDGDSPLTRNGGKEEVLSSAALPRPILLVGDGATDAEARPAVDAFAAYMGVVHRPPVAAAADFVLSDASLSPVLALACSEDDRERLADGPFAALLERGDALLRRAGAHPIGRVD